MRRTIIICFMMVCIIFSNAQVMLGSESIQDLTSFLDVEDLTDITELRTPNSKTYSTDQPGEYVQVIYSDNVHYEGQDGNLYDIRTELTDRNMKSISQNEVSIDNRTVMGSKRTAAQLDTSRFFALQVPFELEIAKNIQEGYSIGKDQDRLTFIPQGVSPVIGKIDEEEPDKIRYDNLWPNTSMTLKVVPGGIKEDIILHNSNAPSMFTFEVIGGLDKDGRAGELAVRPAWLLDKNGTYRDVHTEIRHVNKKSYMELTWDAEGLVYPIVIDPTVTLFESPRVYNSCNDAPLTFSVGLLVGIWQGHQCQSYMSFNTRSIPDNAVILNAYIKAYASANLVFDVTARPATTPIMGSGNTQLPTTMDRHQVSAKTTVTTGSKGDTFYWNVKPIIGESFRNGVVGFHFSHIPTTQSVHFLGTGLASNITLVIAYTTDSKEYYYSDANRLHSTRLPTGHLALNRYDANGNLLRRGEVVSNRLENGDFSRGNLNWNLGSNMKVGPIASEGGSALIFSTGSPLTEASRSSSYPILIGSSQPYMLKVRFKDSTTSGQYKITWRLYSSQYGQVGQGTHIIASQKNQWTTEHIEIRPTSVTEQLVIEIIADSGTVGEAYVDYIELQKGVENPGFENGWFRWNSGTYTGPYFSLVNQGAKEGSNALAFNSAQTMSGSHSLLYQEMLAVSPRSAYALGGWFKDLLTAGNFYIEVMELDAQMQTIQSHQVNASTSRNTNQWAYHEKNWVTQPLTRFLKIQITANQAKGQAFLDHLSLRRL
ncbi:hypothetical protein [Paenibacillus sp. SYP-B4298]|uniref:hypothetical protein n=1 Tax=Paenibacillus sp. SYP-B4298 TaxID=2996034 RepID=UPI0022DDEA8F|nr:hypothetical protein [Paenibacillus sp. SYP-B4298]